MAATNAQLTAQIQELARRLNALAPVVAPLDFTQSEFLATLAKLPHQTNSNTMISTTAGSLSAADRIAINGAIQALNNLATNLQANGFES